MVKSLDKAMLRVRELFEQSDLTLDDLGQRMGYAGDVARKAAWQFLNKTSDPRLSMLRKFAQAVGVPIAELFIEKKVKTMAQKGSKPTTITTFYRAEKVISDPDEQRRLCRKATRTITERSRSGATSGEFEVESGVVCKWREE